MSPNERMKQISEARAVLVERRLFLIGQLHEAVLAGEDYTITRVEGSLSRVQDMIEIVGKAYEHEQQGRTSA